MRTGTTGGKRGTKGVLSCGQHGTNGAGVARPAHPLRSRTTRDVTATRPRRRPTYRESVAVPGWAGLISVCKTGHMGLAFPIPTRIWAFLFARGAEEPDRRGMMWNAERRWRGWGHGFLASAVQHEWDGDSTSTLVQ